MADPGLPENTSENKACIRKGNRHAGVRLSGALLIIDSSGRLSGQIGIMETEQQAGLLPNRSGIKQSRLPQGRGLSWKPGFPGGTGLQSRSMFVRRSFHQPKTDLVPRMNKGEYHEKNYLTIVHIYIVLMSP